MGTQAGAVAREPAGWSARHWRTDGNSAADGATSMTVPGRKSRTAASIAAAKRTGHRTLVHQYAASRCSVASPVTLETNGTLAAIGRVSRKASDSRRPASMTSMAREWKATLPRSSRCWTPRSSSSATASATSAALPHATVLAGAFSQAISSVGPPACAQDLLGARPVQPDRQHPARSGGELLLRGPVEDQPGRVPQRVDARRVGRGDLARAVPDHAGGPHAP